MDNAINPEEWLTALRESGCRISEAQKVLVRIFADTQYPLSAEQAWIHARQSRPETGRATVYRTVERLENLGLLRRIHGYEGCSRFIPTVQESIMLFICLVCGRATYLDRKPFDGFIDQLQRESRHQITESRLQLFGTCTFCQS